jgi:hypothetical protein
LSLVVVVVEQRVVVVVLAASVLALDCQYLLAQPIR